MRTGTLDRAPQPILLRSDSSLIFTSRSPELVKSYGLREESTTGALTRRWA